MYPPHKIHTLAICATALGSSLQLQAGTVTNTDDSGPGSLRDAISAAINGEVIDFAPALNGATITLTSGHLLISRLVVSIDASSLASGLTISGNHLSRIFTINGASNVTIRNITIRDGKAVDETGGGLFLAGGNLEMFDCVVIGCHATNNGGGINLGFGVTATLERCRIIGNSASNSGFGGGIFIGGASSTLIRNCVIAGNLNPLAGGLGLANTSPSIVNCTIQGNSGFGLRCDDNSNPELVNTIIWGNSSTSGTTAEQQLKSITSLPQISYSLVQGAAGSASFGAGNPVSWGPGNLNGDIPGSNPKFADAKNSQSAPYSGSDLRLLSASPALDVGNSLADPGSLDVAGAPRIQSSIVDLGAYEGGFAIFSSLYPTLDPAADENQNGIPNFVEYGMGFDPTSSSNPTPAPVLSHDGSSSILTVNQRSNALDLDHILQTSTTLEAPWSNLIENVHYSLLSSTPTSSGRIQMVFSLISTEPRRFYRQGFVPAP